MKSSYPAFSKSVRILLFTFLYVKVIKSVGNTVFSLNDLTIRRNIAGSLSNQTTSSGNGSVIQQEFKILSPKYRANAGMETAILKQ